MNASIFTQINGFVLREASPLDSVKLLDIYRPYIEDTAISFEVQMPSVKEFGHRIEETQKRFPWLVIENDGAIAGYAYAGPHRSRCAYEWSVDSSVYVSSNFHQQGIGTRLYKELFEILKMQGVINIFAGITIPNHSSICFHESFAFNHIGTYKNVGYKLGKWWDVGWWQLVLQLPVHPSPLVPYSELHL